MLTFIFWYFTGILVSILLLKFISILDEESDKTRIEAKDVHTFILWMIFLSWLGVAILLFSLIGISIAHIFSTDSKFYKWLIGYKEKE